MRVLVTTRGRWEQVAREVEGLPFLLHVVLVDGAAPSESAVPTRPVVHEYADVRASGSLAASVAEVGRVDLDPAAILYTSGSTGRPKGVVLSHRNLVVGAESVSTYLENTADDVILAALPLSFDAGLSQVTTAFAVGAHVILVNYLLPKTVVELCVKHAVTGMTCVPPLWIQLAAQRWPAEASGLRYFANTGGAMPLGTLRELRAIFPAARPYLMYGLTEAFRSTYLDPARSTAGPGSIGKAIPNAEVMVLRPDGTRCDPGEEGELVHRGPLVALGYWEDPERSAERFRPYPVDAPAWRAPEMAVWSGDTVVADEDGFLYFVGRTDDMIKTSGLPRQPDRDRAGRLRDRAGAGRRRGRRRGPQNRSAGRPAGDGCRRCWARRRAGRAGAATTPAALHGAVEIRQLVGAAAFTEREVRPSAAPEEALA